MAKEKIGTKLKELCSECKRPTNHTILQTESEIYNDGACDENGTYLNPSWSIEWQIIKCDGCSNLCARRKIDSEDSIDHITGEYYYTSEIYPKPNFYLLPIKTFLSVPSELQSIYRESIDAYNSSLLILCAAGLRAVIDGIYSNIEINPHYVEGKNKNFEQKINELCEHKIITPGMAEALHGVRYLGNKSLHNLKKPSDEDIRTTISIIENVLTLVFDSKIQGAMLKSRNKSRK